MKPHKLLLILSFMLFSVGNTFAQNNDMKARMEFEDAETAYQNQDYSKAVTHLESAEKLLGKPTSKTRYLLILSKANVFSNTEGYEYKDLEKLRGLCKHYLDNYTTDSEKYREIYDLSNVLNKDFPKTEQEYNQLVFKKIQERQAQQIAELDKQLKEVEELKQAQDYIKSLAQKYGGFVSDITVDEFAKLSPVHQEIVDDYKKKGGTMGYKKDTKLVGPYSVTVRDVAKYNVGRYGYTLLPYEKRNEQEQKRMFEEIVKDITQKLDRKYWKIYNYVSIYYASEIEIADIKEKDFNIMCLAIKIPGLDFRGIILEYSHHDNRKGNIRLNFFSKEYEFESYEEVYQKML